MRVAIIFNDEEIRRAWFNATKRANKRLSFGPHMQVQPLNRLAHCTQQVNEGQRFVTGYLSAHVVSETLRNIDELQGLRYDVLIWQFIPSEELRARVEAMVLK